ncbi:hypothetical protein [Spirosoma litoris]
MLLSFSQLLALAIEIQEETIDGANSADRVGGFLAELVKRATMPYDSTAAYEQGSYIFFGDAGYRAKDAIGVGESPSSAPAKWKIITDGSFKTLFDNETDANKIAVFSALLSLIAGNPSLKAAFRNQIRALSIPDFVLTGIQNNQAAIFKVAIDGTVTIVPAPIDVAIPEHVGRFGLGRGFIATDYTQFGAIEFNNTDFFS